MSITRDDWIEAMRLAQPVCEPDAMTSTELAALFGLKDTTTKVRLRKMVVAGTARLTKKRITDNCGRSQVVTAYQLVKEAPCVKRRRAKRPSTAQT